MSSKRLNVIHGHLYCKSASGAVSQSLVEDRNFRYTLNNSRLSYKQRKFYETNGYLVIPGLVEDEILDKCSQHFIDICNGQADKGQMTLMKDISVVKTNSGKIGEAVYYKAQDILYDEVFQEYFFNDKMLDIVECFTGPNIMGMHSMLINKPPDTGNMSSRHPLHQDLYYFPFRPADHIVASWTAMEEVSEENGCLFVLPGSHKGALYQHDYPDWEGGVNKAFHGVKGFDGYPKSYLSMQKGETVFFHPLLIHGSGYNKTKGFRKAISGHYASSECEYIDVKGTIQEKIADEVRQMVLNKGLDLSFEDIWRYRNRLLRGQEVNL